MAPQPASTLCRRISTHLTHPSHTRPFTSTRRCLVNPLLNLSHFSASKEAQFFSREKKMPREEFYPYIELIRSSEVDPFAPSPGASPTVIAALKRAESGKSDVQTAYTLAIHNLIAQVQVARGEAVQAHAALARMRDKYRREERQSFMVMLGGVAVLALIVVKTDAVQDLKMYARELTAGWKAFDWEWLGNPPAYKKSSRVSSVQDMEPVSRSQLMGPTQQSPLRSPIIPIEAQLDRAAASSTSVSTRSQPLPQSEPDSVRQSSSPLRWSLSRLFWSASN